MIFPKFLSSLIPIVPLLALTVPFIMRFIDNQNKLKRSRHLIDLLKTRDELKLLLEEKKKDGTVTPVITRRIHELLEEIEKEIFSKPKELRIKLYFIMIGLEILTVVSGMYFGILVFLNSIIRGRSWENNLPFLEGVFGYPAVRIVLILAFVIISLLLTIRVADRLEDKIKNSSLFHTVVLLVFNVIFIAISLIISLLLFLLDFLNPWF